eukprot:7203381-Pyramimonas_sp.AAC.1
MALERSEEGAKTAQRGPPNGSRRRQAGQEATRTAEDGHKMAQDGRVSRMARSGQNHAESSSSAA